MIINYLKALSLSFLLSTSVYSSMNEIIIPSDEKKMAVSATKYSHCETEKSWDSLEDFTKQTLDNFKEGKQNGILYVHSYELIMGVQQIFQSCWNKTYHNDQRRLPDFTGKSFHNVFNYQEFIDHYIPFVLANRVIISGSIININNDDAFTNTDTFAPINLIFSVPKQNIALTNFHDACTPVNYLNDTDEKVIKYIEERLKSSYEILDSLDVLVRYPNINKVGNDLMTEMNEIAISACAHDEQGTYRPKIVGVLINNTSGTGKIDCGNAIWNEGLRESVKIYAQKNNLPILEINNIRKFSQTELDTIQHEWSSVSQGGSHNLGHRLVGELTDEQKLDFDKLENLYKQKIQQMSKETGISEPRKINRSKFNKGEKKAWDDLVEKAVKEVQMEYYELVERVSKNDLDKLFNKFLLSNDQLKGYGLIRNFK